MSKKKLTILTAIGSVTGAAALGTWLVVNLHIELPPLPPSNPMQVTVNNSTAGADYAAERKRVIDSYDATYAKYKKLGMVP